MVDVDEGRLGERAQRLARDHQHLAAHRVLDPHALGGELAVGRGVLAERKQRRVLVGRDDLGGGVHRGDSGYDPVVISGFRRPAKRQLHRSFTPPRHWPSRRQARLEQLGVFVVGPTPRGARGGYRKAVMDRWSAVIKEAGLKVVE